jgi:transposase
MKKILKDKLQKIVEQNWSTEAIAQFYKVSARTITRRIKSFELVGLRPRGRKPSIKRRRKVAAIRRDDEA